MSHIYDDAVLYNANHSYPTYPTGLFRGELTISENGLIFRPNDADLNTIPIHTDNIISTFAKCDNFKYVVGENWFKGFVPLAQRMLVGEWRHNYGFVSIKFKEAEFDKLCVIALGRMFFLQGDGKAWADNVDALIWQYKRQLRHGRFA